MSDERPRWLTYFCRDCGWPTTIRIDPGDTGDRWRCIRPGCGKVWTL